MAGGVGLEVIEGDGPVPVLVGLGSEVLAGEASFDLYVGISPTPDFGSGITLEDRTI